MFALLLVFTAVLSSLEEAIRFSHPAHGELGIECEMCHSSIEESEMAADINLPSVEVCEDCHDQFEGEVIFDVSQREILFSHQLHIGLNAACSVCHGPEDSPDVDIPEMDLCLACHNKENTSVACDVCHEDLLDGNLIPTSHFTPVFVVQHKYEARGNQEYCANCHLQSFCAECHRGDNTMPKPHRRGFFASHSIEARKRVLNCQDCHDAEAFCVSCHRDEMVLPISHSRVDWSNRTDGGQHKIEALLDIETCTFCHSSDEPTCEECH